MKDTHTAISRAVSYFHRWLAPPIFDNEDKTRMAAIFNTLILLAAALLSGLATTQIILGMENPRNIPVAFITCALLLAVREVARRGQVSLAIVLFCLLLLLSFSRVAYNNGTVRAMGNAALMVCVIIPTLLIGRRVGLVFVGLTTAFLFGLAQAEIAGALPPVMTASLSPANQWLVFTVIVLYHWALVGTARNSMIEALEHARHESTARKRLEETLHWSEQRFRKTLDNIIEGCQIIDFDWRYVYVNEAVARQGRYKADELLSHTMMEMYPGIEQTELFKVLRQCMVERIPQQMENEFTFPDGSMGWFDLWIQPVPDGILVLSIDITARKQTENALQDVRNYLQQVLDTSPSMIFVKDERGRAVFVNQYTAQYYETTPEQLISASTQDVHRTEKEAQRFVSDDQEVIRTRRRIDKEELNTAPNGEQHWFHTIKVPLIKPDGTVQVLGVSTDITERKQVEEALRESEERLRFVMLATQDAVYDWDIRSGSVFRNEAYQMLFSPNKPVGTDETWWENQMHPDDRQWIMESIRNTFQERKQAWSGEYRFGRHDGTYASVIDRGYIVYDAKGQPNRFIGAIIDFTERKHAEEKLRESEERYRDLVEVCPSAILVQNEGRIVFVNPAAIKLLGAAHSGHLIGKAISEIIHPDYQKIVQEPQWQIIDGQRIPPQEVKFIRLDASLVDVEVIATPLVYQNRPAAQIIAQDITERKQAEESLREAHRKLQAQFSEIEKLQIELHEQATHDQLTGLYNRFYLFDALTQEVPRAIRGNYPISIILLDIDHFKIINDSFGHDAGDEALRALAAQLKALSRAEDILCRYGGDEHLIVMHDTSAHTAVERAEQFRKAIAETRVSHAGRIFEITCSLGVAVFPDHGATIEEVISVADRALYQSKQNGRNCVTLL